MLPTVAEPYRMLLNDTVRYQKLLNITEQRRKVTKSHRTIPARAVQYRNLVSLRKEEHFL